MEDFRWLHFSDLHLEPEKGSFDSGRARQELIRTLEEEDFGPRENLYVFITGDIANKGKYAKEQIEWLGKFKTALGVPEERIFWAAGNHDLKRVKQYERIIRELREKAKKNSQGILDNLRNDSCVETEDGRTSFEYLTVNRMGIYREYYKKFFGRELTEEDTKSIHQFYSLPELNLIVLNTALTSIDNSDERNLFLCSKELQDVLEKIEQDSKTDKPVLALGHHGLDFLTRYEQGKTERSFDTSGVDLYLCGHSHHLQKRPFSDSNRQIQEITCGGGIPEDNSEFIFIYGMFYGKEKGVRIVPYKYESNEEWVVNFSSCRGIRKNELYEFPRLGKNEEKRETAAAPAKEVPYIELRKTGWQLPREWEPDIDAAVPVDDRYALSIKPILVGNRDSYTVFLATSEVEGIGYALQREEEKYKDMYGEKWEIRNWMEAEDNICLREQEENGKFGLVINVKAEKIISGRLGAVIQSWRKKYPQLAVIVNIWSESPYYSARYAQLAFRNLSDSIKARVFLAADLDKDKVLSAEELENIYGKVKEFNSVRISREDEIRELQEWRGDYPEQWSGLLKIHAQKREGSAWICGYLAAGQVDAHAAKWLEAADADKFLKEGTLDPHVAYLPEKVIDNLIWQIYLHNRKYRSEKWGQVLELLMELGSQSVRRLVSAYGKNVEETEAVRLSCTELMRWGKIADEDTCHKILDILQGDRLRMWCFAMACPHAADRVMEMVCSPDWRDEAALVLNLCGAQCLDIVLRDIVSGIRNEIYREE